MKYIITTLILLLFIACSEEQVLSQRAVDNINGLVCEKSTGKPFTGTVIWGFSSTRYKSGVKDGLFINKDNDGKLINESFFKNGELDGIDKSFYGNGNVATETTYKMGVKHGVEKHFRIDGVLSSEDIFENGKIQKRG